MRKNKFYKLKKERILQNKTNRKKFEVGNVFRRISFRCSSTIVNIAESKLGVCCMLNKAVEMPVAAFVGLVELHFGWVADTHLAGPAAALE